MDYCGIHDVTWDIFCRTDYPRLVGARSVRETKTGRAILQAESISNGRITVALACNPASQSASALDPLHFRVIQRGHVDGAGQALGGDFQFIAAVHNIVARHPVRIADISVTD